jgi:transcriptional regulator GlxA family with amidase domain
VFPRVSPAELRTRAAVVVAARYRTRLTVAQVAHALGCSPRALQRAYAAAHTSFSEELSRVRLRAAAELLGGQTVSVDVVARLAGFAGGASLAAAFARRYGVTPAQYRAAARTAAKDGWAARRS